jgi:hypothetical protein
MDFGTPHLAREGSRDRVQLRLAPGAAAETFKVGRGHALELFRVVHEPVLDLDIK